MSGKVRMKRLRRKLREVWDRVKEYVWTVAIFLLILLITAIPDLIYYYRMAWWQPGVKPLGTLCTLASQKGFSYTGALRTLKSNFGILVTASRDAADGYTIFSDKRLQCDCTLRTG